MALALPDPRQIESLQDRAIVGKDLLLLRQWTGLSIADCCYLLGMPVVRWHYYQKRPDSLIEDAGVALLARALLTCPDAHFLPRLPAFAEVEPGLRRALQQSRRPLPDPETALGLLLGRDRPSVARWRRGTGQRQTPAPVRRLLLVLQAVLAGHGVPGFENLVDRVALEAAARGFDLDSPAMTTWTRRAPYRPRGGDAARRPRPPKAPPPEKAADAHGEGSWLPPLPPAERAPATDAPPGAAAPADRPPSPPPPRPMTGRDVLALQRRSGISRIDLGYLLGVPPHAWRADAPPDDRPLDDPALALLVWALTRFPEIRYLPAFPDPAEVLAEYRALAAPRAADLPVRSPAGGGAFSLLLGREIKTAQRWLNPTHPQPPPPILRRLLFAVRALLRSRGAAGLDAWVRRAGLEARHRALDLRVATAWPRLAEPLPAAGDGGREVADRPARGREVAALCRALDLSAADGAYLLGVSPPKLRDYLEYPDRTIDDPALALLVWLLQTYPETRFLTLFPASAAVYPRFLEAAARARRARPLLEQYPTGPAAFGVLLGRSRPRAQRWLAKTDARPAPPPIARLLFALRWLLDTHGPDGLDAWADQLRVEAEARRLDPAALPSWETAAPAPPALSDDPGPEPPPSDPGGGSKRPRGRPRKRPSDAPPPRVSR